MNREAILEVLQTALEVLSTMVGDRDVPGPGNCTRESVFNKRAGSRDRKETSKPGQPREAGRHYDHEVADSRRLTGKPDRSAGSGSLQLSVCDNSGACS